MSGIDRDNQRDNSNNNRGGNRENIVPVKRKQPTNISAITTLYTMWSFLSKLIKNYVFLWVIIIWLAFDMSFNKNGALTIDPTVLFNNLQSLKNDIWYLATNTIKKDTKTKSTGK